MIEINFAKLADTAYRVEGILTFASVTEVLRHSERIFQQGEKLVLDLSGVTHADSAGLALLIEWLRQARDKQIDLTFDNVPEQMLALAKVSGVEELLPITHH